MPIMPADMPVALLADYRKQLQDELQSILLYWMTYPPDDAGGFHGSVNQDDIPDPEAPRGIVMYSRICWTFSEAFISTKRNEHLRPAIDAFKYILEYFKDKEHGGVYWSVNGNGKMLDGKKQIYGQAFCIYAMSAYYKATGDEAALMFARDLFKKIEQYSCDKEHNGYIEALSRNWKEADDLRLSAKDANERKSANTHLHIVEAYTSLYAIWPDGKLRLRIQNLLDLFRRHIISKENDHLVLFFDDRWQPRSALVSFGHDIEAAWLLSQCAEVIKDPLQARLCGLTGLRLVKAALKGVDDQDGGLWYEYDAATNHWSREKHWWPQAEAMVGFFHAWEISGEEVYLQLSVNSWKFARSYLRDGRRGEWFWGINKDYSVIPKEKAGFWKCPYHNGRACMELIRRISSLLKT